MAVLKGDRFGSYEILAPIGAGGMGEVYRARDVRLDRVVALKFLPQHLHSNPLLRERFHREAKAISALNHPHICALYDIGQEHGADFLVMEHLEGETLATRVQRGPLPLAQVMKIGEQIAGALESAHAHGIVHRDLKPSNLILTPGGAKLLDFGLAKLLEAAASDDATTVVPNIQPLTAEGAVMGTLNYMPPEQLEGRAVDARSDIFALGLLLYEMATGKRAFDGNSRHTVMIAILEAEPEMISNIRAVPPILEQVIARCLAKNPDDRWQSAHDIRMLLETSEGGRAALGLPRQKRALAGAALAALVVAAAALTAGSFLAGRATVRRPESAAAAIPRLTQLTFLEGVENQPSISPDGSAFVYVADTAEGNSDIFFQRVGGETAINLTKDSPEPDYQPAFSPDGQTIAYRSGAPTSVGGIYLIGATGESRRRLTDFGFNPTWSPDGKYLAVGTENIFDPMNRTSTSELWRIDVTSGEKEKIAAPGDVAQPSYSPNGRRIAYWGIPPGTGRRVLYTMPVAGGQAVALTDDTFFNWNPIWSPDGRYLYFASNRSGTMNLWRMPIDEESGKARGPAEPVTTAGQWNGDAAISRSGKLLYVATHGSTSVVRFPLDPTTLRVGSPVSILGGTRHFWQASPSPDGEWLVLKGFDVQEDLFVAKADGSGLRRLTNDRHKDRGPAWSPDSATVYFHSDRSGRYEVWRISRDGSGLEQVTRTTGASPINTQVSPDGRSLLAYHIQHPARSVGLYDLSRPLPISGPQWIAPISPERAFSYFALWSPDSRHLAGMSRSLHSEFPGIYVYSLDEKNYEKLNDSGVPIGWLPDGRTILFVDRSTIFAIDRVSRETHQVASIPKGYSPSSISSDGRWIYMLKSDLQGDIWSLEYEPARSEAKEVRNKQ
jgi:eukaryotic-like serine/threonine-protein kinase